MGKQFDEAVSMTELCRAIKQCKQGVSYKDGPVSWYLHRLMKAEELRRDILNDRYKLRPGTKVQIYRPKRREAIAPWFRDRVWQRSMCNNGVYRDLTAGLVYDNYACQVGKGTDLAIRRTIKFLQKVYRETGTNEGWVVHLDVRKYFPSTPQGELLRLDETAITEPLFLPYLAEVVRSAKDERPAEGIAADPFGQRGTGLGSQINQLHQVALLSPIDHELKQFCKHSQRYMDDFLVMDKRREVCVRAEKLIAERLAALGLTCTDKSGITPLREGFYYLRHLFVLTDTGKVIVRLHPNTLRNERRALKGLKDALRRGEVDMPYIRQQYQSFISQAEYSSGDGAIRSMDKFYTQLFREKPTYKRERRYFYGNPKNRETGAPGGAEEKRGADGGAGQGAGKGAVSRPAGGGRGCGRADERRGGHGQ